MISLLWFKIAKEHFNYTQNYGGLDFVLLLVV
jgi:hypothetical protein